MISRASALPIPISGILVLGRMECGRLNPAHHVLWRVGQVARDIRLLREVFERWCSFACRAHDSGNPVTAAASITQHQERATLGIASHGSPGLASPRSCPLLQPARQVSESRSNASDGLIERDGMENSERKSGGAGRNRTAARGFADLCLTTWRPRLGALERARDF